MASQVSDLGQITIDQDVREQLGIEPGMIADQRVVNGRWEVVFLPAPHRRSLFGVFRHAAQRPGVLTSTDVENAVIDAIAEEQA
jgi:bifunctional DNA-binding transcriptional regulator/antitoxin component of YhaV-PrlF toxin-antitoxin module